MANPTEIPPKELRDLFDAATSQLVVQSADRF